MATQKRGGDKRMSLTFYIVANITGAGLNQPGVSGGDRIIIEFIKRWAQMGHKINVFIGKGGRIMYARYNIENVNFILTSPLMYRRYTLINLAFFELLSLVKGCIAVLKVHDLNKNTIIYSASDFWPDSVPAFILKMRNPKIKWIAGFYLFAPKPWQKDSPYKGKRWFIGLFYWLTQLPVYWIIKRYADMVFVTSEPDVKRFETKKRDKDRIVVIRGGVDIKPSQEYLNSGDVITLDRRKYDACFVGRFHYQKGVLELIDIWRLVCEKKSDAKLAMIGVGPLEKEIREKIRKFGLKNNIELLGFIDGNDKYDIFKGSRIILHPATYDSGGMAACEAMAWGLPGVSFDLEALKTYYPQGMIKAPCFDLKGFAENILLLLNNEKVYQTTRKDALEWSKEWNWDKRASEILSKVKTSIR